MHVLQRALRSIADDGTVRIRTSSDQGQLEVIVEDTGGGIPKADLDRVFDPQFTRRGDRVRMDLGFSTSQQTVQAHGGEIHVESSVGEGTKVTIRLPCRS